MGVTRKLGKLEVIAGAGALVLLASIVALTGPTTVAGAGPAPPTFSDVSASHPFFEPIEWVAAEGIAEGFVDGTFRPSLPVSRQAMVAFLYRYAGSPDGPFDDPGFTDVVAGHPFETEIAWAAAEGITTGFPDGTFRPGAPVTRQSAAAFLHRIEGGPEPAPEAPTFVDVSVEHPFYEEITWLAGAGITEGYVDGTFRPSAAVTRQSMAAFLFRLAHLPDPPDPPGPVELGNPDFRLGSDPLDAPGVQDNVWLNLGSRNAQKQSGDRFTSGYCNTAVAGLVTGCAATGDDQNEELQLEGHLYRVSVDAVTAGQPLRIQVYDPAWTYQGDMCSTNLMTSTQLNALVALPETSMDDAVTRYGPASGASTTNTRFCTGDQSLSSNGGTGNMTATSYIVRAPDATPEDDLDNPVVGACTRTFTGRNINATGIYDRLRESAAYDQASEQGFEQVPFNEHFRQWFTLCTIPGGSAQVGDYIVQVRNNGDTSGLPGDQNSVVDADPAASTGGHNRLSLRAGFGSAGVPTGTNVQVEPSGHLATTMNGQALAYVQHLARVDEAWAGETLELELFDLGDVFQGSLAISVVPPVDSNVGTTFQGCSAVRDGTPELVPTMTGCTLAGMTNASYNGRTVSVQVPIPEDYACDEADPFGCWIRLQVSFSGGAQPIETFTLSPAPPSGPPPAPEP